MLTVAQDRNAKEFLLKTSELLYANEAANSLMIGLIERLANSNELPKFEPVLLRVLDRNKTVTALIQTPPYNLVLSFASKKEIHALCEYIQKNQIKFPGVVGSIHEATQFCETWSRLTDQKFQLKMGQKIYKLTQVIHPKNVQGKLRPATTADSELAAQFLFEFAKETLPANEQLTLNDRLAQVERAIQQQMIYFWEDQGVVVASAHTIRPTKNGISIGAVYTPPMYRKKGYASAVVASLSQKMLESGKQFCTLYTDLANPTSNKIYQNIGYREVIDSKHFALNQKYDV